MLTTVHNRTMTSQAMQSFGSMSSCLNGNCSMVLNYSNSGVDGRAGNQPRGTRVVGNVAREVGMFQKQSSFWAQHLTVATHIESNVFFNGQVVYTRTHAHTQAHARTRTHTHETTPPAYGQLENPEQATSPKLAARATFCHLC